MTDFIAAFNGLYLEVIQDTSAQSHDQTTSNFKGTKKYNPLERRDPETALITTTTSTEKKMKSAIVDMFNLRCL